ncbi:MAG: hypothetical protein PVI86_07575 [Phycisphaerae bacterium]
MTHQARMSPLTALFLGIFGVAGVGIVSAAAVLLYAMTIVNTRAADVLGLADSTVIKTLDSLPDLMESLPDALGDALSHERVPDYASDIDVSVNFVKDDHGRGVRPVLTIVNEGARTVSMLAVRVAALDRNGLPIREWTEVVATPVAVCDDWRGVLMPGEKRYVVLNSAWRGIPEDQADQISGAAEISELRLWTPPDDA